MPVLALVFDTPPLSSFPSGKFLVDKMEVPFDFIAEKDADDAKKVFIGNLIAARDEIVQFVGICLDWNDTGKFLAYHKGSFNISIAVQKGDTRERALIRFPIPGKIYIPWLEEKVKNEVAVMEYISRHTAIPIPRVYRWGPASEIPRGLGPFIIEEFVEGMNLDEILKKPTDDMKEPIILDPNIDDAKLDNVYEQLSALLLELSRLKFPRIGAISNTECGDWIVTKPPLTYDMNEVVTMAGFPAELFTATTPFDRASEYFERRVQSLQKQLETHRNIGLEDENTTWKRYVARQCLHKLIPTYCMDNDSESFRLFCDDLRPSNILVDPKTMRITALLDLEFTNVMPAQYAYDVPWWLILRPPGFLISGQKEEFLRLFEPRKEQFIRAMERVEDTIVRRLGEPRLSARMRDSWDSGRFWFNYATRSGFDVDEIYWKFLHQEGRGEALLDEVTVSEKERFLKLKKDQFDAYWVQKKEDKRF